MAEPDIRVLIVDDERTTRFMLNKGLQKEGYLIKEAASGEEALEIIGLFNPHVVLLDIMMPGILGNQLVGILKEQNPKLEVIMVTAIINKEVLAECRQKGAFGVINKPVNFEDLNNTVKEALENQRKK